MPTRLILFVILVGGLIAALVISQQRHVPLVVSGFIEADEIRLGSRVGGRVASVLVEEGDEVKSGQKLVELEPFNLREQETEAAAQLERAKATFDKLHSGFRTEERAQAEAKVAQLDARLLKLRNGPRPQEIKASEAELDLAKTQQELAQLNYRRISGLAEQNGATSERLDQVTKEFQAANALVAERSEQLNLLQSGTRIEDVTEAEAQLDEAKQALALIVNGYRPQEIAEAKAAADAAEAALDAVRAQISELTITAPLDGSVEAVALQPGDLIRPDAPVLSLLDHKTLWVRAYVPEDRLNLKIGQKVTVKVDSFPGQTFTGDVTFIARQAEFTPQNVQTPEERSKQVFRIKVTLRDGLDKLRPGMAADVRLEP
jgi:HlyD family secretion protein